tara:strand:- start:4230 stop:5258 length:1029 start_codon:yes stop_codon:yes gene_type:complete
VWKKDFVTHKHWTSIVREVFPRAEIHDAALVYPITDYGWDVAIPESVDDCNFDDPQYRLVINLQDMLTRYEDHLVPGELTKLHQHFKKNNFPMEKIIVFIWPLGIKKDWPNDSFHLIEFSSHQYETWCSYKDSEDILREAFGREHKDFEYNFVCPQRIYKPHRAALQSALEIGNVSLQTKGIELAYPSLSVEEYDDTYDNLANLLAMSKNYNTALFTIISESQFTEQFGIISEKTFNAIVAGHPFLMCGHQHALENIRHYGFITYNYLFDEAYDDLDNVVRMKDMIASNWHFTQEIMSAVEMQKIFEDCQGIINYNRDYFFEEFGDQLVSELRVDLLNLWAR